MSIFMNPILFLVGLTGLAGPIGCLMIWRRMTFFGETLAHASLIAFLIQYLTHWPLVICMSVIVVSYCIILDFFEKNHYSPSNIFPLLSYGVMGAALLITETVIKQPRIVYRIFIGDVLLTDAEDVVMVWMIFALLLLVLIRYYRMILLCLFSEELALLKYRGVRMIRLLMNSLIGFSVILTVQSAGMLLAMALLTMPSLISAHWSRHPWQMMLLGSIIASLCTFIGFGLSLIFNWPIGPTITVVLLTAHLISVSSLRLSKFLWP